jgi:hypothetical protein
MTDAHGEHGEHGHFVGGNKLGRGRPKGAKNKPPRFKFFEESERSMPARRFRGLAARMAMDLGGVDVISTAQKILIQRCAMLTVECERMERETIAGAALDVAAYGQMTGHLARALRALGLKRVLKDVTPTLATYLDASREPAPEPEAALID